MVVGYAGVAKVNISGQVDVATGLPVTTTAQTIKMYGSGKAGVSLTAGTGLTLITPTATKTLYITSITAMVNFGGTLGFELRDGGSGGTVVYSWANIGDGTDLPTTHQLTFPTPLKFSTSMWLDATNNNTIVIGASGFEQ